MWIQANEEIVNFSVCPNEKLLVFFTNSELLRVITLEQRKVVHLMKMPKMFPCDMAYSADAKYLAIGFANSLVKIYTVETMRETHSYRCHQMAIKKLEWHPDVNMLQLVSADEEKNIAIFDYILNKPIATAVDAGKSFVLTPSARQLITVCDQAVHVYEYKTLRLEYRIDVGVYIDCVLLCAK